MRNKPAIPIKGNGLFPVFARLAEDPEEFCDELEPEPPEPPEPAVIVRVTVDVADAVPSVPVMVNVVVVRVLVAAPEITPVEVLKDRPLGSPGEIE